MASPVWGLPGTHLLLNPAFLGLLPLNPNSHTHSDPLTCQLHQLPSNRGQVSYPIHIVSPATGQTLHKYHELMNINKGQKFPCF